MTRAIRLATTLLCAVLAGAQSYGAKPTLNGSWTGSWARNGDALTVTMHFNQQNTGWVGRFDSDRLRVIGIPLRDVVVSLPRVRWKIVGDATTMTFDGELHGNTLAGDFEENGAHGTFHLRRTRTEAPEIQERDFTFNNGNIALSGTLLLPKSERKVPAVVFLHGSGAEARWASKYLATQFARTGIAALIYDKRGVGQSGGDWRTATFDDLAADAAAAVDALGKNSSIDPARIGLHGHSQGGTLAPLVVAKLRSVAFVIASAAAGLPVDQVEVYSLENSVNVDALSAEDAALARRYIATLVGVAYRGEPRQQLSSLWEQVRGKAWAFPPPAEDSPYWYFSRTFNTYAPITYWRRVKAPVLLLYGESDKRVPPRASAARIAQAALEGAGNSVSVHIFPDADHTFRVRPPGLVWPTTAPGYPDILIQWTRQITGSR